MRTVRFFLFLIFITIFSGLTLLLINDIWNSARVNILSVQTLHGLFLDPGSLPAINRKWDALVVQNCQANWTLSRIAKYRNEPDQEMKSWLAFLACSPNPVDLLKAAGPEDPKLAEQVVMRYPHDDSNWIWLADLTRKTDPSRAMGYYQEAVKINPANGYPHCAIGLIYQSNKEYLSAFKEYATCCINGDPGFNGCLTAGMMMEKLKDKRMAIVYYRLSKLPKSHEKADLLEQQLSNEQP